MTRIDEFQDEQNLVAYGHGRLLVEAAALHVDVDADEVSEETVTAFIRYCAKGGLAISAVSAELMLEQQRLTMIGESHD
jgi:hypothetical protein